MSEGDQRIVDGGAVAKLVVVPVGCAVNARQAGCKAKIRESGLWLVNELYKEPLGVADLDWLKNACTKSANS